MTVDDIRSKIVRKGICLYAGVRKYGVYLCKEDILYGTGDYEDAPGIADDQNMECYTVYFGDLLDVNTIRASAGQYKSFEKAVEAAESSEGFQNWEVAMDNHVGYRRRQPGGRELIPALLGLKRRIPLLRQENLKKPAQPLDSQGK